MLLWQILAGPQSWLEIQGLKLFLSITSKCCKHGVFICLLAVSVVNTDQPPSPQKKPQSITTKPVTTTTKKSHNSGGMGFIQSIVYIKGSQGRNLRQWLKQGPLKMCCLLTFSPLLAQLPFLYNPTQQPRYVPAYLGWTLPQQPTTKKMPHRHANRPIWWKQSLNWSSLFLAMSKFLSTWQKLSMADSQELNYVEEETVPVVIWNVIYWA